MEADQKQSSGDQSVAETVIVIEDGFSCCVDVNCGDSQIICRICHLNSKEDLIELGCVCKGELGLSHLRCAEAWFNLKGNRLCEICGETAQNVRGLGSISFMEEWSDGRFSGDSDGESRGCRGRQPLCNFLMGCLVIAFVLPWFFRVNL